MRRAAIKVFRTACLTPSRNLALRSKGGLSPSSYVLGIRHSSGRLRPVYKVEATTTAQSPMYFRRFSVALLSGLVGYGAWYTYKGQNRDLASVNNLCTISSSATGTSPQSRTISTTPTYSLPQPAETTEAVERKAVIIGADNLYTGAISGNEPITKDTDDSGRKIVEMLTPDEATQKLRRNEESYLVGRGKGVVRYDVVQIPSNDPIEDDHSEKIIELPQALTTQNATNDWMFWGVFDGHS
jgi:pyruvate dehydrogenase phosphatase